MHARNLYRAPVDFRQLAARDERLRPFVSQGRRAPGQRRRAFPWHDAAAQAALTAALLRRHFYLEWTAPLDHLIPPVPNRLNYLLWVEDLLASCLPSCLWEAGGTTTPTRRPLRGVDVGTGASCILQLLGTRLGSDWVIAGSEIDAASAAAGAANLAANGLEARCPVLLLKGGGDSGEENCSDEATPTPTRDPLGFFAVSGHSALTHAASFALCTAAAPEALDFMVCNPPFFGSWEAARRSMEGEGVSAVCTGTVSEMVYEGGGEVGFVSRLINESYAFVAAHETSGGCWFTSLIGLKASLVPLMQVLKELGCSEVRTTALQQGRTRRWALAWRWGCSSSTLLLAEGYTILARGLSPEAASDPSCDGFDYEAVRREWVAACAARRRARQARWSARAAARHSGRGWVEEGGGGGGEDSKRINGKEKGEEEELEEARDDDGSGSDDGSEGEGDGEGWEEAGGGEESPEAADGDNEASVPASVLQPPSAKRPRLDLPLAAASAPAPTSAPAPATDAPRNLRALKLRLSAAALQEALSSNTASLTFQGLPPAPVTVGAKQYHPACGGVEEVAAAATATAGVTGAEPPPFAAWGDLTCRLDEAVVQGREPPGAGGSSGGSTTALTWRATLAPAPVVAVGWSQPLLDSMLQSQHADKDAEGAASLPFACLRVYRGVWASEGEAGFHFEAQLLVPSHACSAALGSADESASFECYLVACYVAGTDGSKAGAARGTARVAFAAWWDRLAGNVARTSRRWRRALARGGDSGAVAKAEAALG